MSDEQKLSDVKLLIVIVDRNETGRVAEVLRSERVRFHFIVLAEGTAGSEIMALLGLDSIDKSMISCLEPDYKMPALLKKVSTSLQLQKPGKGIAFTMPISGISNSLLAMLTRDCENEETEEMEKLENGKTSAKYDLIVSVVNQGHAGELMESARSAGATGGTVLHGRKLGVENDAKFLGITAQLEKDIVAILASHEKKVDIMRAITKACGLGTESHGVIFSLRVDDIEGLQKF
jgi:nitrogen regulatory protein PII